MSKKAIVPHTLFIIGVIVIFMIIIAVVLFNWIDWSKAGASSFSCNAKLLSYCSQWRQNDNFARIPWDWNSKDPKGCENLNPPVLEPTDPSQCQGL
jgi:hypothetical protein